MWPIAWRTHPWSLAGGRKVVNKAYFSAAELGRRRMMSGYGLHMFLEENDAMIPIFSQVVNSGQETLLK